MSDSGKELGVGNDTELEQLLSHASPRAMPDAAAQAAARRVVHDEWRSLTNQQQRRRRVGQWLIAASLLIAVFSVLSVFRPVDISIVQVAEIQKSFGSVYILGEQAVLIPTDNLLSIRRGQTIVTDKDAGLALAWNNGGSVRIAENSQVEFRSDTSIFLHSGRVYFDSTPSPLLAGGDITDAAKFVIETEYGVISHVGTQFMATVEADKLTVRVREGRVAIEGLYYDAVVEPREKVIFNGQRRPKTTGNLSGYGEAWAWIARTSPPVDVDGKSIDQFLTWASRELGMEVEYADVVTAQIALDEKLLGRVDHEPGVALRLRMATTGLRHRIEGGVIYVSNSE